MPLQDGCLLPKAPSCIPAKTKHNGGGCIPLRFYLQSLGMVWNLRSGSLVQFAFSGIELIIAPFFLQKFVMTAAFNDLAVL